MKKPPKVIWVCPVTYEEQIPYPVTNEKDSWNCQPGKRDEAECYAIDCPKDCPGPVKYKREEE